MGCLDGWPFRLDRSCLTPRAGASDVKGVADPIADRRRRVAHSPTIEGSHERLG